MNTYEATRRTMACETRLLTAFREKDLHTLDQLVHAEALFVLPNGRTITKAEIGELSFRHHGQVSAACRGARTLRRGHGDRIARPASHRHIRTAIHRCALQILAGLESPGPGLAGDRRGRYAHAVAQNVCMRNATDERTRRSGTRCSAAHTAGKRVNYCFMKVERRTRFPSFSMNT